MHGSCCLNACSATTCSSGHTIKHNWNKWVELITAGMLKQSRSICFLGDFLNSNRHQTPHIGWDRPQNQRSQTSMLGLRYHPATNHLICEHEWVDMMHIEHRPPFHWPGDPVDRARATTDHILSSNISPYQPTSCDISSIVAMNQHAQSTGEFAGPRQSQYSIPLR